ncbi:MAG: hypothetical protein MR543_02905 [Robinsoniella sp.]|nr:hypothetical protein [Robinsoniella sp.]
MLEVDQIRLLLCQRQSGILADTDIVDADLNGNEIPGTIEGFTVIPAALKDIEQPLKGVTIVSLIRKKEGDLSSM